VPLAVGNSADVLARVVGKTMAERMGTSVVVDNKPGASGSIGAEFAAHAAPDGYTLFSTSTTFVVNKALNPRLRYDPLKDYTPIALLATGEMGFIVSNATPAKSIGEFVALAKSKPGTLNYASPGSGTPHHLAMELFKLESGIQVVHVPYKEQRGMLTDVVAGRVEALMTPLFSVMPQVQSGKIRLLGMLSAERSAMAPAVPTFKEAGYAALDVHPWFGLLAPAGLPNDILARLSAEVNAALALREVRDTFTGQGLAIVGGPPERLAEWLRSELERWSRVVAKARISAD
jgi:tripartite-type tricarboxylate transporter receptor subunit TctC